MTIDELKQFCDNEFSSIDRIMNELFSVYKPEKQDYSMAEQASVAALVVNVYSGTENILKQMLVYDKLDVSDAPGWHEKVLRKSNEIGILPPDLYQVLTKYLTFRNYFIYAYIFNIKWDDIKALVDVIKDVVSKFRSEVDEYISTI